VETTATRDENGDELATTMGRPAPEGGQDSRGAVFSVGVCILPQTRCLRLGGLLEGN
jgi:hypothetical protein